eukprot:SAG11_NODE_3089_length_2702_cov_3.781022_6_plen_65_part_00
MRTLLKVCMAAFYDNYGNVGKYDRARNLRRGGCSLGSHDAYKATAADRGWLRPSPSLVRTQQRI